MNAARLAYVTGLLSLGLAVPALGQDSGGGSQTGADRPGSHGGRMSVLVQGVRNTKGKVGCLLFDKEDGFPSNYRRARARIWAPIRNGQAICSFENLPAGTYAVGVLHDEDMDREMDTNVFGMPEEGWGVTRNAEPGTFGPPDFEDCCIRYDQRNRRHRVRLRY